MPDKHGTWYNMYSTGPVTIPTATAIFISSTVALMLVVPSLINKSRKMSSEIPFGPYIIVGCILYVAFANQIKYFLF